MKLTRFEILLPLAFNDGAVVSPELLLRTHEELVERFGAATTDTAVAKGTWVYRGIRYEDRLMRVRVDTVDSPEVRAFLADFKVRLKERFRQEDIWITASAIEVL